MSDDLEQRLRDSASQAARVAAVAPMPDPPSGRRYRPGVFALASVVGVVAIVVGFVVMTRQDSRNTISPSGPDTTPTTAVATTDMGVVTSSSVAATSSAVTNHSVVTDTSVSSSDDTANMDTSLPPPPTTTTEAVATGPIEPGTAVAGTPITDDHVVHATPAALGVVPAGYRVALATEGASSTSSDGVSWAATYIHEPVLDGQTVDYVQVQINAAPDGDPYTGFPGLDQQPDVQIGSLVGRWYDFPGIDGYSSFVSVLDDQRQLLVSGHATRDVIASTVAGITLSAGGGETADVTIIPDGYILVDESPGSGPVASWEFNLLYAKGQAWRTAIEVRTLLRPEHPALMQAIGPDAPRIVDIDGLRGVIVGGTLTIDVAADYQVQLTVGGPVTSPSNDNIDQLVALGQSLVSIGKSQFTQYQADAAAAPFSPTDEDCDSYVTITNPRSNATNVATDGTLAIQTPGTITVDISTSQSLGRVEILLRVNGSGDLMLIGSLPSLETTATVDLTWDGTINGEPAPAATYGNLAVHADPADTTNPDACTNLPAETYKDGKLYSVSYGRGISLGAVFVVS